MSLEHEQHIIIDPGTPYDWEHPEAYRQPQSFSVTELAGLFENAYASLGEVPDIVESKDKVTSPRKSPNGLSRLISRVATIGVVTLGLLYIAPSVPAALEEFQCPDTESEEPIEINKGLEEARAYTANMEFGIEMSDYIEFREELKAAGTREEVQAITQKAFDPFGWNVRFGDMPRGYIGPITYPKLSMTHSDELLTAEEAKASAQETLLTLSQIPASFLENLPGMNLYLSHAPERNRDKLVNGLYTSGANIDGKNIVIDTSFPENVRYIFKHELGHALQNLQCNTSYSSDREDPDFTNNNPADFSYHKDAKLKDDAAKKNITSSPYAAEEYQEDYATTTERLLSGDFTHDRASRHKIIAGKQEVVAQRLGFLAPGVEQYFAYLGYIGNRPFPKEIASYDDLTAECFPLPGVDGINKKFEENTSTVLSIEDYTFHAPTAEQGPPRRIIIGLEGVPQGDGTTTKFTYQIGELAEKESNYRNNTDQLEFNVLAELEDLRVIDYLDGQEWGSVSVGGYAEHQYGSTQVNCYGVDFISDTPNE